MYGPFDINLLKRTRSYFWTWGGRSVLSQILSYLTLLTYLLTYLLTPCSRVLLEKLTGFQLVKKFPAFYGTRRFIIAVTSARHLSLSCASSIQSIHPHPTSWRSIWILPSHLRLGLPSVLFPLRFPHQNPVYASPRPRTHYMPRPSHSSRFYHPNSIWWAVQIIQLLIMQFPPLLCYLVPRRPKYSQTRLLCQPCFMFRPSQPSSGCLITQQEDPQTS